MVEGVHDLVAPVRVYQIGDGVPWNEWEANLLGVGSTFRDYDVASAASRAIEAYASLYTRVEDRDYTKSELINHLYSVCDRFGLDRTIAFNQITQESSFNPRATGAFCVLGVLNKKCGAGIAQFIPATGRAYGLRVTSEVDDRFDPIKSLDAYGAHMRDLLDMFGGDYLKALAAYNTGAGNVQKAIERNGDGWLSGVAGETQAYVITILGERVGDRAVLESVQGSIAKSQGTRISLWDILTSDLGPDLLKRWALFSAAMIILLIALLPAALKIYKEYRP